MCLPLDADHVPIESLAAVIEVRKDKGLCRVEAAGDDVFDVLLAQAVCLLQLQASTLAHAHAVHLPIATAICLELGGSASSPHSLAHPLSLAIQIMVSRYAMTSSCVLDETHPHTYDLMHPRRPHTCTKTDKSTARDYERLCQSGLLNAA